MDAQNWKRTCSEIPCIRNAPTNTHPSTHNWVHLLEWITSDRHIIDIS